MVMPNCASDPGLLRSLSPSELRKELEELAAGAAAVAAAKSVPAPGLLPQAKPPDVNGSDIPRAAGGSGTLADGYPDNDVGLLPAEAIPVADSGIDVPYALVP
jgi:hypothetical protein